MHDRAHGTFVQPVGNGWSEPVGRQLIKASRTAAS
jgi:hypothetical protein